MKILGIETSCDETSAAIVESNKSSLNLLSNIVASSVELHAKTGGIIPENAAREQLRYIIPVIKEALEKSEQKKGMPDIDAVAITVGPGLMGSLVVGVEPARVLSYIWKIPLIPVSHLYGHIYANFIGRNPDDIPFPAISLVVSGGHTDLVVIKKHKDIKWIGGTRDDAAGEALDKIGRLIDLPYPAGPTIEKLALEGDPKRFDLPRPMIGSPDFDFSFSGLKTAALREVKAIKKLDEQTKRDLCASVQKAIIAVLIRKTLKAARKYEAKSILLGGGVTANQSLRDELELEIENSKLKIKLFVPTKSLCTDNGAMIAAAAFFQKEESWKDMQASPSLHF